MGSSKVAAIPGRSQLLGEIMMFQGRSVISAVWGVVPAPGSRQASQPVWSVLRLFRRQARPAPSLPRLQVPTSELGDAGGKKQS